MDGHVANHGSLVESTSEPSATTLGSKIRVARLAGGYGVRELARLLQCSPSLISQIERDKANPSVNTLYSIANVLGISVDSMFDARESQEKEPGGQIARPAFSAPTRLTGAPSSVQHKSTRLAINLDHGVRWELLTPTPEHNSEFMEVTYPVGSSSAGTNEFVRHSGREYAVILEGTLRARIGDEEFALNVGDSLTFDPTTPHRFWNDGTETVRAVWFVQDRWTPGD
jgi:transcriptional regulator with XRE-family HTH domain